MSGILGKFHVEHSIYGVRVIARGRELTGHCTTDAQIDAAVEALKNDLDACAREMRRLVEVNNRGALFEGWPKASDFLDA